MTNPRLRSLFPVALICASTVALAACGDGGADSSSGAEGGDAPAVVATTSIWADVTSEVACGEVDVTSLIPLGTDAHAYEPSVQDADLLLGAGLIVANGLGLEEGALDAIEAAEADGVPVVELGDQLDPIEGGHTDEEGHAEGEQHADEEGHSDGEGMDPHVWMDPDRVALAVPLIAEGLKAVDGLPVDAEQIDACAQDYVAELTALSADLDEQFAALTPSQRKLVTNHEALGYLADRFDLEVIGAIIPSTSSLGESNVRDLEELASTMQAEGVTRIYGEVTGSDEVSAALAEQVGSQVEIVELFTESLGEPGSGAETYLEMMRTNGDLIAGQ
jgi:zinc/manganese transport system substrate-binding protein